MGAAESVHQPAQLRILLVEDDLCLETSVYRILRHIDHRAQVSWTTTGEEALVKLQNEAFDLIIVDYTLAGMTNGLFVWDICRKKHPHIPFILMSGLPVETFLNLTQEYGARPRFLPKPFLPHEFKAIVQESLHAAMERMK